MISWLVFPPVVFAIIFCVCLAFSYVLSRISFCAGKHAKGQEKSYACGENNYDHTVRPDYSSFFSFAFFFTLAHVATLILTTVPKGTAGIFALAGIYIAAVILGLYIILRREV
jgi:NADH:ubiquinone oxidoreductase subunit 3 (subunit A)